MEHHVKGLNFILVFILPLIIKHSFISTKFDILSPARTMEKFCLKWNDFQTNVSNSFSTLRKEQDFYDVTLVSDDDKVISAHKVVLSASSEFFKSILKKADHSKPMIYLSGVESKELNHILDYIYEGEVQFYQEDLDKFLTVAEKLKIDGLIGGQEGKIEDPEATKQEENLEIYEEDSSANTESSKDKDIQPRRFKVNSYARRDRTISAVAQQGTNVYEEAKKAVDQLVMKVGETWVCKTCNKSTQYSTAIRKHAEIHIEGLSFPCQLCGDTFRSRYNLANHRFTKH